MILPLTSYFFSSNRIKIDSCRDEQCQLARSAINWFSAKCIMATAHQQYSSDESGLIS